MIIFTLSILFWLSIGLIGDICIGQQDMSKDKSILNVLMGPFAFIKYFYIKYKD